MVKIISATSNSAEVSVGAATLTIRKVSGKLKVTAKYPQECRVPKKLMHETYVAAAEAMKEAQQ